MGEGFKLDLVAISTTPPRYVFSAVPINPEY